MDIFRWWVDLWNPLAKPKADLSDEALKKYTAGEIDLAAYLAAIDKANELEMGIKQAEIDYRKAVNEKWSLDPVSIFGPAANTTKTMLYIAAAAAGVVIAWKVIRG